MKLTRPGNERPGQASAVTVAGSPILISREVALEDLCVDPDRRKIGYRMQSFVPGCTYAVAKAFLSGITPLTGEYRFQFHSEHRPGFELRDVAI